MIFQSKKSFTMEDTTLKETFTMTIFYKFPFESSEKSSGNRLLTRSLFSNFFQSFYGIVLFNQRMLDSNVTYCIIILVMLLGSSYAISVQRIKTLIGYRSMTLAPH